MRVTLKISCTFALQPSFLRLVCAARTVMLSITLKPVWGGGGGGEGVGWVDGVGGLVGGVICWLVGGLVDGLGCRAAAVED